MPRLLLQNQLGRVPLVWFPNECKPHSGHQAVEGSLVNYENIDNIQTGIHDYFKYLKFGFCRVTDLACLHLRRGRLSREQAIAIVKRREGSYRDWETDRKSVG